MKGRSICCGGGLLLLVFLVACSSLPREAREAVLASFPSEEQPYILSARKADLLPEDETAGVEQIWCVRVGYRCWSCPHAEWHDCVSSYLVRRVHGEWVSAEMRMEEEWREWEARGCPPEP